MSDFIGKSVPLGVPEIIFSISDSLETIKSITISAIQVLSIIENYSTSKNTTKNMLNGIISNADMVYIQRFLTALPHYSPLTMHFEHDHNKSQYYFPLQPMLDGWRKNFNLNMSTNLCTIGAEKDSNSIINHRKFKDDPQHVLVIIILEEYYELYRYSGYMNSKVGHKGLYPL